MAKHDPGIHAQSWCEGRFTHSLCSGYRFDTNRSLRYLGLDLPPFEGKVEILCSCSCHERTRMISEDPEKFAAALGSTVSIFGASARECDSELLGVDLITNQASVPIPYEVLMLSIYLGVNAGQASNKILEDINVGRDHDAIITYTVFEQCYFLFLHLMNRVSFRQSGQGGRTLIQDALVPIIYDYVRIYLRARYRASMADDVLHQWLDELEEHFGDRLNLSELEYARFENYQSMKDKLAVRLASALVDASVEIDPKFTSRVNQAVGKRGQNLGYLIKAVLGPAHSENVQANQGNESSVEDVTHIFTRIFTAEFDGVTVKLKYPSETTTDFKVVFLESRDRLKITAAFNRLTILQFQPWRIKPAPDGSWLHDLGDKYEAMLEAPASYDFFGCAQQYLSSDSAAERFSMLSIFYPELIALLIEPSTSPDDAARLLLRLFPHRFVNVKVATQTSKDHGRILVLGSLSDYALDFSSAVGLVSQFGFRLLGGRGIEETYLTEGVKSLSPPPANWVRSIGDDVIWSKLQFLGDYIERSRSN